MHFVFGEGASDAPACRSPWKGAKTCRRNDTSTSHHWLSHRGDRDLNKGLPRNTGDVSPNAKVSADILKVVWPSATVCKFRVRLGADIPSQVQTLYYNIWTPAFRMTSQSLQRSTRRDEVSEGRKILGPRERREEAGRGVESANQRHHIIDGIGVASSL